MSNFYLMGDANSISGRDASQKEPAIKPSLPSVEAFAQEVNAKHPGMLHSLSVFENTSGNKSTLAVVAGDLDSQTEQLINIASSQSAPIDNLETIDAATMATIQRLIDAGVLSLNDAKQTLHTSPTLAKKKKAEQQIWLEKASKRFAQVERKYQMGKLLLSGDFVEEALQPTIDAIELGLSCFYQAISGKNVDRVDLTVVKSLQFEDLKTSQALESLVISLRQGEHQLIQADLEVVQQTLTRIEEEFVQKSLS